MQGGSQCGAGSSEHYTVGAARWPGQVGAGLQPAAVGDLASGIRPPACDTPYQPARLLVMPAVLTVRAHSAASHAKKGWERFTDGVISQLSARRQGVVFLLWGRYAQVCAGCCCGRTV